MKCKKGFILNLPVLIILGAILITLIGFFVFHFEKFMELFTSSYFLIGIAVVFALVFYSFTSKVLIGLWNAIYPLIKSIFKVWSLQIKMEIRKIVKKEIPREKKIKRTAIIISIILLMIIIKFLGLI